MDTQAYPLTWPTGWPRTAAHMRDAGNRFGKMQHVATEFGGYKSKGRITPDVARKALRDELARLGAKNVVLSTNVPLRNDGEMRADYADRRLDDPGVAIYFTLNGKQMTMAQDAFASVAANMRSLSLAIEALRALERHGGGRMMERAFSGFAALPGPETSKPWWQVLGIPRESGSAAIREAHRRLIVKHHTDAGGNDGLAAEINAARDAALQEKGL